jgi:pimeloyl-ACP methyl ester carboxylesterase
VPAAGDGLVSIGGGRSFSYRAFGDEAGMPLFALHGTPGSRLKFVVAHPVARAVGLRVIAPDRWGYGATERHPRPSLKAFAEDMAAFADALGIGRFAIMGVSGGGPFAAAVASEMPDRVSALALAAPVGPIAGEADTEITPFHRLCFGPLAQTPAAVGALFHAFRAVLDVSPDIGMRMAMMRIAAADRRVLRQRDVAARLGETFVEGLRPGVAGPITDLGIFGAPWDVDLARAKVPARLWIGSKDQNVPRSAARRLAMRLPDCELTELGGQGHLWIATNYDVVLGWIAQVEQQRS